MGSESSSLSSVAHSGPGGHCGAGRVQGVTGRDVEVRQGVRALQILLLSLNLFWPFPANGPQILKSYVKCVCVKEREVRRERGRRERGRREREGGGGKGERERSVKRSP